MFAVDHLVQGWALPAVRTLLDSPLAQRLAGHGRMAAGHWLASQTGLSREDGLLLVGGLAIIAAHYWRPVVAALRALPAPAGV